MRRYWWFFVFAYLTLILFGTLFVHGRSALEWVYLLVPPGMIQEKLVYLLHNHHPVTFSRLLSFTDIFVNIFLFVPFGLVLARLLQPRVSWDIRIVLCLALGLGLLFSVSIEMLQAYVPQRVPSLSDILYNAAGSVFGCYLPYFWKNLKHHSRSA